MTDCFWPLVVCRLLTPKRAKYHLLNDNIMNKKKLVIALAIFTWQINAFAQEHTSIPDGVEVIKDITYVKYQDRELLLDIYRPSNSGDKKLPTIIVIRGGGWARGDKEGFGPLAAALALRGFAAVCIEYRPSDEAIFPAAVFDTKSATSWIKDNADMYNFDSNSIGAIGGSAGAHLAMLLGASSKVKSLNPAENTDYTIQAVVGLATPTEFGRRLERNSILTWLGKPYKTNEELWASASPISYIDEVSPPMLLIHSSSDDVVPYEQSILAIEKLGRMGVYSELILIPDADHGFWWNFEEWFEFTMDKAAAFFHEQLGN